MPISASVGTRSSELIAFQVWLPSEKSTGSPAAPIQQADSPLGNSILKPWAENGYRSTGAAVTDSPRCSAPKSLGRHSQRLYCSRPEEPPSDQIDREAGNRHHQHGYDQHFGWLLKPSDRLKNDVAGNREEQHRVGERGEDLKPIQPVGSSVAGRRPVTGDDGRQRHSQTKGSGSHVPGVGGQTPTSRSGTRPPP